MNCGLHYTDLIRSDLGHQELSAFVQYCEQNTRSIRFYLTTMIVVLLLNITISIFHTQTHLDISSQCFNLSIADNVWRRAKKLPIEQKQYLPRLTRHCAYTASLKYNLKTLTLKIWYESCFGYSNTAVSIEICNFWAFSHIKPSTYSIAQSQWNYHLQPLVKKRF